MNIGNNKDKHELSSTDYTTFDDMTFDDEPLQEKPNQNNKFTQKQHEDKTDNHNKLGNTEKQNTTKATKTTKAHKEHKQKNSKKQSNKDVNQAYNMTLNNQTVESEEKKPLNLKIVITVAILVVAAIVGIIVLNLPKNADKDIVIATNTPVSDDSTVNDSGNIVEVGDNTTNDKEDASQSTDMTVLELNNPMKIDVVVNTKIDGDTEYTDHQSYLKVEYTNFISGYDNVKTYLDEYNETSNNKINLPGKEDFYATSVGNDLVMYEVTVSVPDDFPTNDKKHGYTGLNPEFKFEIKGTEKEDALITKLYEFAIPSIYFIGSDTSEFLIGNTYTLRYMTTMPMDLKADGYELFFIYSNDESYKRIDLQSVDIPKNNDVVEIADENSESVTDSTELILNDAGANTEVTENINTEQTNK